MLSFHLHYLVSDVNHLLEEPDGLVLDVDLFVRPDSPESVFEVVVFGSTQRMYVAICTMVIRDHEAVLGYHTSGTAEFE